MFEEVHQIRRARKKYNLHMFRSGVDSFRAFQELEADALEDGALAQKYKELIALGVSIARGCHG
jgi:alkylhydroperoxidase/carboxymuconolactone decarboxylase family protein YurZ